MNVIHSLKGKGEEESRLSRGMRLSKQAEQAEPQKAAVHSGPRRDIISLEKL